MKILITNDDGINAVGINKLISFSQKYGSLIVCAPKVEQSAKSHSICIKKPMAIEELESIDCIKKISVDSTPADCVRYVYYGLEQEFDIVFSGINNGFNCGEDIIYSGTVAAALEGCLHDKKAIAFSNGHGESDVYTQEVFDMIMDFIFEHKLLEKCDCLNVNVPRNNKGIKFAKQGKTHFNTTFDIEDGLAYERGMPHFEEEVDEETDTYLINQGYITISPLTISKVDVNKYEEFKRLDNK